MQLYDKTDPALQLYLLAQTGEYRFLEDRFLNLIKSLESYHQKSNREEMKLKERIKDVIQSLKKWCDFYKAEQLITDIVSTRNYFTHYNLNRDQPLQGKHLYDLCLKIDGILQLTFIKEIGFSDSKIQYIMTTCQNLKTKIKLLKKETN